MSPSEEVSGRARALEKEYDWVKAADLYEQALLAVGMKDFLKRGEIQERIGFCFHRAAMQAESRDEFREIMKRAIEAYEKAHGFYEKLTDERKAARKFRCDAVAKYLGYWLTSNPSEKRKLLDDCLELEGKALAGFLESQNMLEYGKTYNELLLVFFCRIVLEWDMQTVKSIVERGLEWGEKAVAALSELGNLHEVAMAYFTSATCLDFLWDIIEEPQEKDKNRLKLVKYVGKAVDLSEKVGDLFLLGLSHIWLGMYAGEEALRHFEKTLECGKQTRDNFLIASGLDYLAYITKWKAIAMEDPEKRRELAEKSIQFYKKGQHHYSIMQFTRPLGGLMAPPSGEAEHYFYLAMWETDPEKRLEFLEKSEKAGMEALKLAEDSDIPRIVWNVLHVVSKTLETRAHTESDPSEKRSLLEKSLRYREKTIEINAKVMPFHYWDRGVMYNYLAGIKAELADIEPNLDIKRRLLEEAVLDKEKCLELCDKDIQYFKRIGSVKEFSALRRYQDTYATLLTRLYDQTKKQEHLRKAIEISEKAIESARKLDMLGLIAESYWKIAKAQDILGEHLQAAQDFELASNNYKRAAEKIPQLKDFYQDQALYMQAWSEIEKARHHHGRQEYGSAKEHFEKAAGLHKSLKQWSYLAPNYSAWSQVENAEDLSRKEQGAKAVQAFEEAAELFDATKKSIQTELNMIEDADEKQMATDLIKASDLRREYCMARIALEEAKILDKKGDHYSSSEKYGSAAETFEQITEALESERDRKELKLILTLSRAWQKMTQAEAEASPALYLEASQLFEEAKVLSPNEKAKMLALGHSRFCKALEAGTKFADTRDTEMHATAMQHLESAANYYLKAGFQNASEYAKATELLFDAYRHIDNAKKENDPEKKARLYAMAERVLQTSAGAYMKAEHPEKREQILRLLEKVGEERELALSLSELLHAPPIVSTAVAFATPLPAHEKAIGLERFEQADIQVNVITSRKSLKVGENLDLELELVNTGKGPALLIKLEEVVPKGFELTEKPQTYRLGDGCLDLKGKRLDPLKTEEVRLILKPKTRGVFPLKPRIIYLDENGKYKSHEPEPIPITVKELGIKGWIKGEG